MSTRVERFAAKSADAVNSTTMEYGSPLIGKLRRFLAAVTNLNNNKDKYKDNDGWEDKSIKLDIEDEDKEDSSALDATPVSTSKFVA